MGTQSWRALILWTVYLVACIALGVGLERTGPGSDTRLSFLSVGQGDCTVFQHAGFTLIIDAGPRTPYVDSGRRYIRPALRERGIRTVDLILITHPDMDHVGGLPAIAERYEIGRVGMPGYFRDHPSMLAILDEAGIDQAQRWWIDGDYTGQIGQFQVQIRIPEYDRDLSDNDLSLWVHISSGEASALFTGDAGHAMERQMLQRLGGRWKSRIVKAGHHGSRHSTSTDLLRGTVPDYVVMSCGRRNSYGHPHDEVLSRAAAHGATLLRTDILGDIDFGLGREGFVPMFRVPAAQS